MSDQPEQKKFIENDKRDQKLDKPPDAGIVRNATGEDKQVALAANPNEYGGTQCT